MMSETSAAYWRREGLAEFEAGIDVLERALRDCPDQHWDSSLWVVKRTDPWMWPREGAGDGRTEEDIQAFSAFWLVAYHCLFFLDFYLWDGEGEWGTPAEFANGPEDQDIDEHGAARFPNDRYSREQLHGYAAYDRDRARSILANVGEAELQRRCPSGHPRAGRTFAELLDVNLAHLREHGEQLRGFLASGMVTRA